MRPLPLLTVLITVGTLQSQVGAEQTKDTGDRGALDVGRITCGPKQFSGPGGQCQRCSLCTDRVVASPCTGVNDTICGSSCASGYIKIANRCVRCSLELLQNPGCPSEEITSSHEQAVTIPRRTDPYSASLPWSVMSDDPEMGFPIIYVALGLGVFLLGIVSILCWIVFCTKNQQEERRRCRVEQVGANDENMNGENFEAISLCEREPAVPDNPHEGVAEQPGPGVPLMGQRREQQHDQPPPHPRVAEPGAPLLGQRSEQQHDQPPPLSRAGEPEPNPPLSSRGMVQQSSHPPTSPTQQSVINITNAQVVYLNSVGNPPLPPAHNPVQNSHTHPPPHHVQNPANSSDLFINPLFGPEPGDISPGPPQPLRGDDSQNTG